MAMRRTDEGYVEGEGGHLPVELVNLAAAAGRTHTIQSFERIPLTPTVECDLGKGRSAQRLPAFKGLGCRIEGCGDRVGALLLGG